MKRFVIGDEEYTEEVNTSYDQDQEIGDEPQALNTELSNSEPIDAPTGGDFYTIQTGGKKEGYGEFYSVWKQLGYESYGMPANMLSNDELISAQLKLKGGFMNISYLNDIEHEIRERGLEKFESRKQQQWYHATDQTYLDDEPHENRKVKGEKLNKDGTGTAVARRGINPNNKKHIVMKFDYVSQSDCPICRPYDGKTFGRDSPNRPVIPRLESQGKKGGRPYTHPNCKCRWIKVFNEVYSQDSMIGESVDPKLIARARKEYGNDKEFDAMSNVKRNLVIIGILRKDLGMESESEEFIELVDPLPLASMAQIAFNAIKEPVKTRLRRGEAKVKATEQEGPYGIQPLLDQFVDKSLGKEEKEEIEEEVNKDFTLDNLLQLVADKLAKKAAKKMGLESHKVKGNEDYEHDSGDYKYKCLDCDTHGYDADEAGDHSMSFGHKMVIMPDADESYKVKGNETSKSQKGRYRVVDIDGQTNISFHDLEEAKAQPNGYIVWDKKEKKNIFSGESRANESSIACPDCGKYEMVYSTFDFNYTCKNHSPWKHWGIETDDHGHIIEPKTLYEQKGHVDYGESLAREDVISNYRDTLDIDDSEEFDRLIAEQDRIIEDMKNQKPKEKIPLPDDYDKWTDGSFSMEHDVWDDKTNVLVDPSKLEDKKEAEELDPNHFKDPETWYNATQGIEREKLAGGGLSDPYDGLPDWNRENIDYAYNAKKDGEQVDRSDFYPESYSTEGTFMNDEDHCDHDAETTSDGLCNLCGKDMSRGWWNESKATEGGRGSGRLDHKPWMLGTELSDVCEVCMISTEWNGTVCTMCGTDSKTL